MKAKVIAAPTPLRETVASRLYTILNPDSSVDFADLAESDRDEYRSMADYLLGGE
jgi:hypothetical protein